MAETEIPDLSTRRPKVSGAALMTGIGLASAFKLAACCALPLMLGSLGLGSAWLGNVAPLAGPANGIVLAVSALALTGGGVLLWRQQNAAKVCGPDGVCSPPAVRILTLFGLLAGAGLLIAQWYVGA